MKQLLLIGLGLLLAASPCLSQGNSQGKGKSNKDNTDKTVQAGKKDDNNEQAKPDNQGQQIKALNQEYKARKKQIKHDPLLNREQQKARLKELQQQHKQALKRINSGNGYDKDWDKKPIDKKDKKDGKPDKDNKQKDVKDKGNKGRKG